MQHHYFKLKGEISIRIIISPAKKMKIDNDVFVHRQMPRLMDETNTLSTYLQSLSYEELKSIWKCSDNLVKQNFHIIQNIDLYNNLTPALLSYEGLQYQYMAPGIFTNGEIDYLEKHLRILSGFYGILKPFDGIVPYRLEMQAKLIECKYSSLYDFWADKISKSLFSESKCILNLASKEYSKCIIKYLPKDIKFINCIFGQLIDEKIVEKGTLAKMPRGEMVRFMAENSIERVEDIIKFNRLDYVYKEELSDDNNYIFIKIKS